MSADVTPATGPIAARLVHVACVDDIARSYTEQWWRVFLFPVLVPTRRMLEATKNWCPRVERRRALWCQQCSKRIKQGDRVALSPVRS